MQSMHVLIGRMGRLNFPLLGGGSWPLPRDVVAQQSLPAVGFLFIGNPERSSYWIGAWNKEARVRRLFPAPCAALHA
jgi:hypothetical protein